MSPAPRKGAPTKAEMDERVLAVIKDRPGIKLAGIVATLRDHELYRERYNSVRVRAYIDLTRRIDRALQRLRSAGAIEYMRGVRGVGWREKS